MLNAIIVTDGGKDPVPQKDDTETFWNGMYWKTRKIGAVCDYRARYEVAAGVC